MCCCRLILSFPLKLYSILIGAPLKGLDIFRLVAVARAEQMVVVGFHKVERIDDAYNVQQLLLRVRFKLQSKHLCISRNGQNYEASLVLSLDQPAIRFPRVDPTIEAIGNEAATF